MCTTKDLAVELYGSPNPCGIELSPAKMGNLLRLSKTGLALGSKLASKKMDTARLARSVNADPNVRKLKQSRKELRALEAMFYQATNSFLASLSQELADFMPDSTLDEKLQILTPGNKSKLLNPKENI